MGNYRNFELEFVQRTLALITQYEGFIYTQPFERQYNYTLLVNCLLGLIVMPKEKSFTYLPKERLTNEMKKEMGLMDSIVNEEITTLQDLIISLRHSIAHFDFEINSNDENFLFDEIIFNNNYNKKGGCIAVIKASEFLPFLRYYSTWLIHNLQLNQVK
jgi:hypothetical protein